MAFCNCATSICNTSTIMDLTSTEPYVFRLEMHVILIEGMSKDYSLPYHTQSIFEIRLPALNLE